MSDDLLGRLEARAVVGWSKDDYTSRDTAQLLRDAAARVRELEDALRAERERCAQIAESQTLAEQTTWTQAGAHVARVIREGET
jgi:hypothetical protein